MEHGKCFKQARKIFTAAVGTDILNEFVKRTKHCTNASDASEQEEVKKEAHERWMTQVFVKNADKRKCGKLMSNLKEQHGLGHDQCPKTAMAATDALDNHEWDDTHFENLKKKKEQRK